MENFFENGGSLELAIATFKNIGEEEIIEFYKNFQEENPEYCYEDITFIEEYVDGFRIGVQEVFDEYMEIFKKYIPAEEMGFNFQDHLNEKIPYIVKRLKDKGFYGIEVFKIISEEYGVSIADIKKMVENN